MFEVRRREGPIPTIELRDGDAKSRAVIAPARGAIAIEWSVGGDELLYLDEGTFLDREKNVRGGVPVLFPSPGKLEGDRFTRGGRSGEMKQHGFARTLPWEVVAESIDGGAKLVVALVSSDATRAQYPWDFFAEMSFLVRGPILRIEQRVTAGLTNPSTMPFGFGFHPYFLVPDEEKRPTTIETNAKRAFDNVTKSEVALHGIDLTQKEVDLHLLDHGCSQSELAWPRPSGGGQTRVRVRASDEYQRFVIWTVAGKPFVCLEPWTCPGNALNSGEKLIELAPGATWSGFVELERVPPA